VTLLISDVVLLIFIGTPMIRLEQAYMMKMRIPPVKPGIANRRLSFIDNQSVQNSMIYTGKNGPQHPAHPCTGFMCPVRGAFPG
jgi:hypothetical protein